MRYANYAAMMCGPSARVSLATRSSNRRRYFASAILRVFLISQEPDILQALLVCNDAVAACPRRAMDKHRYDVATRLLWLEAGFHSLASGFPQHGIPTLWWSSDQYLYVERNSHEPQRLRHGIHDLKPICGHSFYSCRGFHCALGNSQNIWHRFDADSRRRTVALPDRFETLALLDGIWSAHGHGNQLWHDRSGGHGHHAMVQPLSGKDHGSDAIGIGICGFFCRAADQPHLDGEWRKLAASVRDCGRDNWGVRRCGVFCWPVESRR